MTAWWAVNTGAAGSFAAFLVYGGTQEAKTADGIEVWPVSVFLSRIANGKLWP